MGLPPEDVAGLAELMRSPKVFSRDVAIDLAGPGLLRVGDHMLDWLEAHLSRDERGRAFAVARPAAVPYPEIWLHSDFIIEFDVAHFSGEDAVGRLERRAQLHFPPAHVETWTNPHGEAPSELVNSALDLAFDSRRDEVIRGGVWEHVLGRIPDWAVQVAAGAEVARTVASRTQHSAERREAAVQSATEELKHRTSVLAARSRRLPSAAERESSVEELALEERLGKRLIAGLDSPSLRMIACGAILLWPKDEF